MTLIQASGLRKNRSAVPLRASSRPPARLWLAPAGAPEGPPVCDLPAAPLRPHIWMSEATRVRACALQDAPGLALGFRQALLSLTGLYQISEAGDV